MVVFEKKRKEKLNSELGRGGGVPQGSILSVVLFIEENQQHHQLYKKWC